MCAYTVCTPLQAIQGCCMWQQALLHLWEGWGRCAFMWAMAEGSRTGPGNRCHGRDLSGMLAVSQHHASQFAHVMGAACCTVHPAVSMPAGRVFRPGWGRSL